MTNEFHSSVILSALGVIVLLYRLQPWRPRRLSSGATSSKRMVSIIVPCRNEAGNVGPLLSSLLAIDYPRFEILIVDDHSTDDTVRLAKAHRDPRLRVIESRPKPITWVGKTWACAEGARLAEGEILLFSDADTRHTADSLKTLESFMAETRSHLVSCPPYHACESWWERLLGPFQLFSLVITAYRQRPRLQRVFAIGQYLAFRREAYETIGGHARVRDSLAEDIDFAKVCLSVGQTYSVYPDACLYSVQMYGSLGSFLAGWRRLLRLGLNRSDFASILEIAFVLHVLTFAFGPGLHNEWIVLLYLAGAGVVASAQFRNGRFHLLGALLAPLSVLLFIGLTLSAVLDQILGRNVVWRGRSYSAGEDVSGIPSKMSNP